MDKQGQKQGEVQNHYMWVDAHIRRTRIALSLKFFYNSLNSLQTTTAQQDKMSYISTSEFGFRNPSGPIIGRYIYLITKLLCLYVIRGIEHLYHQISN